MSLIRLLCYRYCKHNAQSNKNKGRTYRSGLEVTEDTPYVCLCVHVYHAVDGFDFMPFHFWQSYYLLPKYYIDIFELEIIITIW